MENGVHCLATPKPGGKSNLGRMARVVYHQSLRSDGALWTAQPR